ncbi:hypothetical protein J0X19_22065 [Hymenobacter sp. BT186]|uniref:Uncharacterized protein n=1 Tax=Hymenobacter telluris TaxID=2816474 RepID=A0A939F0T0_9BACT|nr:hypothetical protein [Hymenobacter telluris]MBO0360662.1 hypothetical protein [Hymenobacter telluris]MBW3376689.1 hypothetical protein [Hymenobacter norwichensis]
MITTPLPPQGSHSPLAGKSLTKARVYWASPTGAEYMDFFSFDTSGRYAVESPKEYGVRGLKKLVDKLGVKVARCIIYDRELGGEYCRKENHQWTK